MRSTSSVGWLPAIWQQFVDAAVQVRWQPGEHVLEVSPGAMPAELGRLHQAHQHGRTLPGQFTAREQPAFLPIAQGRIRFSLWLLSTGTRPSFRCAVSALQAFRLKSMARAIALPSGTRLRSSRSHTCNSSHNGFDRAWRIARRSTAVKP